MSVSFGTWSHTASVTGKKQAPKSRMNKEDKQHNIHTEHTHITHFHTTRTTLTHCKLAQRTLTQRTITQRTLTQRSLTQRNSLLHVPKRHLSTTDEKQKSKPVHTHATPNKCCPTKTSIKPRTKTSQQIAHSYWIWHMIQSDRSDAMSKTKNEQHTDVMHRSCTTCMRIDYQSAGRARAAKLSTDIRPAISTL